MGAFAPLFLRRYSNCSDPLYIYTHYRLIFVLTLILIFGFKMTSTQQRALLQRQIWQIANEVRGAVDGWDFKQYVLGTLFYRFISENFANYIEGGDDSIKYAQLPDSVITAEIKDDAIKQKVILLLLVNYLVMSKKCK